MFRRAIPLQLVAMLLALAPMAAGCGSSDDSRAAVLGPGRILAQAQVNNQPVQGVTVALSNSVTRTATTGADGVAAFENLESGTYAVRVTGFDANQFLFPTDPVSVTINTQTGPSEVVVRFDGTGAANGSFSGLLTVNGQAPFQTPGRQIVATLVPPSAAPVSVNLTGTTGQMLFQQLVPGTYTLRISVDGQVRSTTFTLAQGQQLVQNIEFSSLTPVP